MKHYIKDIYSKKLVPIIEVWESYTHWYWFITEKYEAYEGVIDIKPDGKEITELGVPAFGLVYGHDIEWGSIWMPHLEKNKMIWKVPESAWSSISHVVTVHDDENIKEVIKTIEWKH